MQSTAELVKLPLAQRLALIDDLLASIPEQELAVDSTQVEEAMGRLQELKSNPAMGLTYAQLKSRLD